ncbi:hypothetical protein [Mesorhizobium sp.]|uniref:hypothetical protein n=1 Tax=Mesorhizobium sp. TaxID=1871066 RepID=UPI000FE95609|nr:hypothetical protein [Mesorhizobium sp.]RWK54290.1 MAG: hypothetical protein EOR48_17960 [Mesorhizobium sp.]TIP42651.1 MAG: hypothetical protein E5X62_21405 [Mesorhizobium sp.]
MKYARIIDGVVDSISYDLPYPEGGPEPGWTEVRDNVFAGFSFDGKNFTGPEPTPRPRKTVLKSVVQARIIEAGKMAAAYAALTQNPIYFARWFAPDRPEVYCDDPDAIQLVTALGLDPDAILAPA